MQLHTNRLADGTDLVQLAGRLDSVGVASIEAALSAAIAAGGARVLVDLSQVTFLASIGIRALLTHARALARRGGSLALVGPRAVVAEVLDVTGIGKIIPVFADVEAASAASKAPAPGS